MRPGSIVWFERLNLLAILLVIPIDWLMWDELAALETTQGGTPLMTMIGIQLASNLFWLLLVLMVSRGRNVVFKWIYAILTGLSLVGSAVAVLATMESDPELGAIQMTQAGLLATCLVLLFWHDSTTWLAGRDRIDPEIFR